MVFHKTIFLFFNIPQNTQTDSLVLPLSNPESVVMNNLPNAHEYIPMLAKSATIKIIPILAKFATIQMHLTHF